MENDGAFGRRLRQLRRVRDLTQEALAQASFCALETIKKIEAGRRRPSRQMAAQLADVLGLEADERAEFLAAARANTSSDGPDEPSGTPDTLTTSPRQTNLPVPPTSFIGRERDVAAVRALLARPEVRLVTLSGPGGAGKTRLALQVAAELQDAYADGVWFVDLAPLRDPALVLPAVAEALGVVIGGTRPAVVRMGEYLRDRQTLLILDNVEHLLDAAPDVGAVVTAAPGLRVLATSRAALRLQGEWDYALPPLAEDVAQELFVARARAVKAGFTLTADNAAAVAAICARLDGMPLAVELAAARVRVLAPAHLLGQLDRRLQVLTGGARDAPARQRTLRDTVAWSYDLLDAETQRLFRRIGVFVGGCTLAAAEAVAGDGSQLGVLDGVESLVDAHLLLQVDGGDEPRFRMLETIREYALERLEASAEGEAARRQHADYYVAFAEAAEPYLHGARKRAWIQRLEAEHDNLRAALAWSIEHTDNMGLRLAGALGRFWHLHGHHREGRDWLLKALDRAIDSASADRDRLRAKALNQAGYLAMYLYDNPQADSLLEQSVALWRAVGEPRGLARALCDWGATAIVDRNLGRAHVEESIILYRQLGEKQGLARALFRYGFLSARQGKFEEARISAEESIALGREVGYISTVAASKEAILAYIAFRQGDYLAAQALGEEGLQLYREVDDTPGIAIVLGCLGTLAYLQGQYEQAKPLLQEQLQLLREMGGQYYTAWSLYGLGYLALRQDNVHDAIALFVEGLLLMHVLGERYGMARCLAGLAEVAQASGQLERAAQLLATTQALLETTVEHAKQEPASSYPITSQAEFERHVTAVRAALGDEAFAAAWAAGRAMTLEQAVAYALSEGGPA